MTSTFSTSENGVNEEVIVESIEVNVEKIPTFSNSSFEPVVLKQSSNGASINHLTPFKDFSNAKTHTRARSNSSFSGHNSIQMPTTPPDLKLKLSNEYDNVNLNQLNISDISSPLNVDYSYKNTDNINTKQEQIDILPSELNQKDQEVELTVPVLENNPMSPAEETPLEPISPQDSAVTLLNSNKEVGGESSRLPTLESMENLLCDRERFAYLGLVKLCLTMGANKYPFQVKEFISSHSSYTAFTKKTMQKMYTRLNVENEEIQMIEKLSMHGVIPEDMAKTLLIASKEVRTTTFKNPLSNISPTPENDKSTQETKDIYDEPDNFEEASSTEADNQSIKSSQSTKLETIQVDLRWTILLDLFLVLTLNDTYDSRSRSLLYMVAEQLELEPENVWNMEQSVADQLQICDLAEELEHTVESKTRNKMNMKKRIALMGVASVGGGLVIGLSAGLMAPAIGIGLGVLFTKVGLGTVSAFLGSAGGIGIITGGSAAAGTGIAGSKMEKRTRGVETFKFMPVENRNRINVVITVTGWLPNDHEDASLPFSVLDPSYGDHFSVLWEPKMLKDLGNALRMLAGEVLQFAAQEILKQTLMSSLLAALAPAMALSKLGYLIDNPWSNGLDRAQKAGLVLADILLNHSHGNRPVTLIGFSLGARMIFYCLLELARVKAFGIVQDVFIFGSPVTASKKQWAECSGVVSGRFVNGYVKSDWILGFLYRASSASLKIAGLHPVEDVDGIENKDVTHLVSGHLAYRKLMPLLMKEVGIPVTSDTFEDDELELASDQMTELEASDNIEAVMSGKVQLGNVDKGIAKLPAIGAHKPSNSISTFFSGSSAKRPTHTQGSKSWLDSSVFQKFKWSSRSTANSQAESGNSIFNKNATLIPISPSESDQFMKDPSNITTLKMPSAPAVISPAEFYATQEKQINFSDLNAPITAQVRARPTNRYI